MIDVYDHTREGEVALSVLADYQHDLSEQRYVSGQTITLERRNVQEIVTPPLRKKPSTTGSGEVVSMHDAETLAWVKKLQQQARHQEG